MGEADLATREAGGRVEQPHADLGDHAVLQVWFQVARKTFYQGCLRVH